MPRNQCALPGNLVFPLTRRPTESYKVPPRSFGARRKNGRKHAGCDLYAPVGTPVRAMAAGRVIREVYRFYCHTYALEIDHGYFVARYGELLKSPANTLKLGSRVAAGAVVGAIGQLSCYSKSMLHLEIYEGTSEGALTDRALKPYQRRADLLDPTPFLDAAGVVIIPPGANN